VIKESVGNDSRKLQEKTVRNGNKFDKLMAFYVAAATGQMKDAELIFDNEGCNVTSKGCMDLINFEFLKGSTPLSIASKMGHYDMVKLLLQNHADLDHRDYKGMSALHWAAYNGHQDVVDLIVETSALNSNLSKTYPDPRDCHGNAPLYYAVYAGHKNVVRTLLDKRADINASSYYGNVIHAAVMGNQTQLIRFLINKGANVHYSFYGVPLPIDLAISENNTRLYTKLYEYAANDLSGKSLQLAVKQCNEYIITQVLSHGVEETDVDLELFFARIECNINISQKVNNQELIATNLDAIINRVICYDVKFNVFDRLIDEIIDQDYKNMIRSTAFEIGLTYDNNRLLNHIIQNGFNINYRYKDGNTLLHKEAPFPHKQLDKIKLLVDNGALVNVENNNKQTPLFTASYSGDLNTIEYLIIKGGNYNDSISYSSLHEQGSIGRIQYLIDLETNSQVKEKLKENILRGAVTGNNIDLVKHFIESGMDVNKKYYGGVGLLHDALTVVSYKGSVLELVKYLVSKGANIDVQDDKGLTVMHLAVFRNDDQTFEFLLNSGGKINVTDSCDATPYSIALSCCSQPYDYCNSILQLIENHIKAEKGQK
jgi:ankyrin repeat protein